IRQIEETPAFQLCAIAQIEIFREGDILPAPCVQNGTHAPDAAGAVEVHQPSGAVAGGLFDDEMPIQRKALPHRQYIVFAVQVSPTRLYHAKLRIVYQRRDGSAQKIGIRCEVSVEDGDHFNAFEERQPVCQRSGFVALPRAPAHVLNVQPTFLQLRDFVGDDRGGFVGRIVKYLNRQFLTGVVKLRNGIQKALDYVHLIVNGKLNGNSGPLGNGFGSGVAMTVAQIGNKKDDYTD